MNKQVLHVFAAAGAAALLALPAAALAAAPTGASPLGLAIGVATCNEARQALRHSTEKAAGQDTLLTASDPGALYADAGEIVVRCSGDAVIALRMKLPKGGMDAENSRAIYAGLNKKYKQVAGGAMPTLGDGYARFASGNTVIEQDAPHLSFDFTVTYYTKSFYDQLRANAAKADRDREREKQAGL